jgi:threonine/homoserine/homoserine lactone efflux protein
MDLAGLSLFAFALFVAAASPGPGIAAIVARVLGRGPRGAVAFTAGVAIGDVVWLSVAVLGLAMLAQTLHGVFVAIKYLGAAYLLWLAYKLWTTPEAGRPQEVALRPEHPARTFLAGLALTLGNPKAIMFYLALLPTFLDLAKVTLLGYASLVVVTLGVLAVVFGGYILLAARMRLLLTSGRAVRYVNRGTGAVMACAAAAIAAR